MVKKFIFSCNLFQKVKISYILDSLYVKQNTSKVFKSYNLQLMKVKNLSQNIRIFKFEFQLMTIYTVYIMGMKPQ